MSNQGKWWCPIQDGPSRSDSQGEWVKLEHMRCPVSECGSGANVSWVCGQDGNNVYLNEYGKIKCALSCHSEGIHIGDVGQSGWKCGDSFHKDEYIRADCHKFTFAISDALRFSDNKASMWIVTLVNSLQRQFKK